MRNFLHELRHPKPDKGPSQDSYCRLQQKLSCCAGRGYLMDNKGPFLRAHLCDCLLACANCAGTTRMASAGRGSKTCVHYNPIRVMGIINTLALPSRYASSRLQSFNNYTGNGRQVVGQLTDYLQRLLRGESRGLLIEGPVGVGKTFLLAALCHALAQRSRPVRFVDFFQLLADLKAGYSERRADADLLKPLIDVEILAIDELGKGRNNDWELSILDQLVMGRYNQCKIILATTNYSLKPQSSRNLREEDFSTAAPPSHFGEQSFDTSLEDRVGSRIYSRLLETCETVSLSGNDYRRMFVNSIKQRRNDSR